LPIYSTTDFSLSVTATASDADGEDTTSAAQSIAVTVSPDAPVLSVTATAAGAEDTAIPLVISASITDGAETVSAITVSSIPVGATLSDGTNTFTATALNTSVDVHTWTLSKLGRPHA